jgi:hypothetical protein
MVHGSAKKHPDKVDLVFNTSVWWQPRWNFTWKNISIFLQNVSHNGGQRLLHIVY